MSRSPSWPKPPAVPPPTGSSTRIAGQGGLVAGVDLGPVPLATSRRSCRARATHPAASRLQAVTWVPVRVTPRPVGSSARWNRRLRSVPAPGTSRDTDPSVEGRREAVLAEVQRHRSVETGRGRCDVRRHGRHRDLARLVGLDLHGAGCDQVDRAQPADDLEAGEHRPILPDLTRPAGSPVPPLPAHDRPPPRRATGPPTRPPALGGCVRRSVRRGRGSRSRRPSRPAPGSAP